ncbi:MAG: Stp1/IreP family PP2C-type Ser/Thr phosphatase [Chitinophagaceae bacterium]|nr:MAG: Stp1/IreP family PP2C-type Ser/Thr phosphatase [Chitinophagaceae bacterium]
MWWKNIWNTNKPTGEAEEKLPATEPELINVAVKSDVGNLRTNNEDAAIYMRVADKQIADLRGCLLMVADGMGGHQAGEVASRIATEAISQHYFSRKKTESITEALSHAYRAANSKIYKLASLNQSQRGMGTTCTSLVIAGNQLYYAHVGDSRAYLLKENQLKRITEDHTYVQELLKNKEIDPADAATHPKRNILTNAMGTKPELRVDAGKLEHTFEPGDKILICSDGLSEYFIDSELAQYLSKGSPETIADQLIATAKQRGGHDNITVIVAEHRPTQQLSSPETRDIYIPITREYDII